IVEVETRARAPSLPNEMCDPAHLFAGVRLIAATTAVRERQLSRPGARFVSDLHATVRIGEIDSADLPHKRGIVLQPQAVWQEELPCCEMKFAAFAVETNVSLAVDAGAWCNLLIQVQGKALR